MNKILLTLSVSFFSVAYSQNLNFADSKFKALILSSNPNNEIAKDSNGNPIAVDTNGDGEIQASEAQQVKILSVIQDPNQMYIDPNGNPGDVNNINLAYYNSHLPDGITDALLFPNVEELNFRTTKSANISFINNSKIKKVKGRPYYYDMSQQGQYVASAINLSFDNCSGIQNIADVIAYQSTLNPWSSDQNILRIKNCAQINSNAVIDSAELTELYIENSNISTLTFNSCKLLKKISVPNLSTITKISVLGDPGATAPGYTNQNIDLIANNCINLQEITADTDHYNTSGAYFSSANLNGCTALKKIKGLNSPSVNFSTAGLINLEELDCSFYNRYVYYTTSGSYFGDVTSLNLAGLPKLKILKAFNQPITNNVNFTAATALENIDITNSSGYMTTLNVSNLHYLNTLKSAVLISSNSTPDHFNLQNITAQNCTALTDLQINGNFNLKTLNLQNCSSLQSLNLPPDSSTTLSFSSLNTLNILQCAALNDLTINNTKITELLASDCVALSSIALDSNASLTYANIKNGSIENAYFFNNNTALSMCVDAAQLADLQSTYSNITFTSSCGGVLSTDNLPAKTDTNTTIFPNPVKDFVQVKSSDTIKNVKLFDGQGRIIFDQNFNQNLVKINLSSYPNGVYTMKITAGKEEVTKKIIKN
ncbi:T9SS type A sorting domain-containing protein [Chryseobacterium sp. MIQD13]|uniref:T9SS type A sorting domain-containing protein n=1 Tax=Chryseobacterium sp. MIQD13 TaxID=3422310 RepID=UPI003D296ABB